MWESQSSQWWWREILTKRTQTFQNSLLMFTIRSIPPEVLLRKGVLKISSKFTGEHPCRSVISIKLPSNFIPAKTDVFKTSLGRLKKVTMSCNQTKRHHHVWKKMSDVRRLEDVWFTTSSGRLVSDVLKMFNLCLLEDVQFTLSWRRPVCDVLKTSVLWRLEDVWFTTSWRCPIYVVWKKSNLQRLENVWFTTSWRRLIYDVLKTYVKRRRCSNVVAASIQRQKKWFFVLFCTVWNIQKILSAPV